MQWHKRKKPKIKLARIGCELLVSVRRKRINPKTAKYQIPIGSKAALTSKPAISDLTIAKPQLIDQH